MESEFYCASIVAIASTLRVITHTHPVRALLYLVVSMLAIACVFFSLGANFAGALEIIVYASAVMVLFIFVIMMLNIGNVESSYNKQRDLWFYPKTWIGPSLLSTVLLLTLIYDIVNSDTHSVAIDKVVAVKDVGIALFGPYMLTIELSSILLTAGLVTAFHIGR